MMRLFRKVSLCEHRAHWGPLVLPIVGEIADLSSNSGSVILSRRLYEEWWSDPTVSRLNVYLEPGAGAEDIRRRIAAQLGTRYRLKILARFARTWRTTRKRSVTRSRS